MNQTDFQPLSDADWPESLSHLQGGFATRLNVYRAMAHHPALLAAWAAFRDHVVVQNVLGDTRSEIVILRAGHNLNAEYEWAHHVVRGRKAGLSDARIASMRGVPADMAPDDAVLARAVDELFASHALSPATQRALVALVGPQGVLDVMATVAHYTMLGFIVKSFATPVDQDIRAALAADPAP